MFNYLFSPIKINELEIKNRIAYPALGLLYSYDSKLNDRYINFFEERAKGGSGIITVGPVGIDFLGSGIMALSIANDEYISSFKKLTAIIKTYGARAWIQLFHAGAYSFPFCIENKQPIAPSPVYCQYSKTTPREMTIDDIHEVQNAYSKAALRAKEAGFDGVEILASAGYLITQFLSPVKNQRNDNYGGSFENRLRFPIEVIKKVRQEIGHNYPFTIRMAGNDFVKGSNTDNETPEIAKMYENAGVDAINVTGGWHESKVPQLPMQLPRSAYAFLALNVKKHVKIPVMASNRITTPDIAEKVIKDGCADMVNLGRVLIADPYWPKKAFEGKANEIRPCVACSQGCTDRIFSGQSVFCIANPLAGFESERKIIKTKSPKKVMIIGAGPAGLEAAITADKCGHYVELYEKDRDIGGQLHIAGAPPHKNELLEFIRYYKAMLNSLKIQLFLNQKVDKEKILEKKPDCIIIAQGSEPLVPDFVDLNDKRTMLSWDILKNSPLLGKEVAIIGGGSVGLETALFVASKGTINPEILHFLLEYDAETVDRLKELMFNGTSKVTVFEMLPKAGKDVGKSTKWILMKNLQKRNVKIITGAKVKSINNGVLVYEKDSNLNQKEFDNIIIASGSKPTKTLVDDIEKMKIPYYIIGDSQKPGQINDAIHGGFLSALKI